MTTTNKNFKVKNGLIVGGTGVFDGTVSVSTPTETYHAATKEYVDNNAGGATVSDVAPSSPAAGDQWYNTGDGVLYIYYDSFWVEAGAGGQEASLAGYATETYVDNAIAAIPDLAIGSANQVIYKDSSNAATGSSGLTYNGSDLSVAGKISSTVSSGDEGGEIFLNKAQTNTTLNGGVTIDVYQNRLRFFEQGGSARGFYLDMPSGGSGVSTGLVSNDSNALGLQLITSQSFSASTAVSVNDVFSSTYENYKVILTWRASGNNTMRLRVRTSGSDYTGNKYFTIGYSYTGTINEGDTTSGIIGWSDVTGTGGAEINFFRPFTNTSDTAYTIVETGPRSGSFVYGPFMAGGGVRENRSDTGFTIYPDSGNITGTIRVYGVKN